MRLFVGLAVPRIVAASVLDDTGAARGLPRFKGRALAEET